jgi:ABC-type nickel/cobalt efflux system permease component RcnA
MIAAGTVLLFGLLLGMQHALEADHLAAVATLVAREPDGRRVVRQGMFWGLGHTLTLLAFGGLVMVIGVALSDAWVHGLEGAVGVMLVLLGLDLLRRLGRERVHFHAHRHAPAAAAAPVQHFHAHTHQGEHAPHDRDAHHHEHRPLPLRALLVGMVHGLAGSAALVLLTLQQVGSPWVGLVYILLFGLGSVAGMAALSWAVSWPMRLTAGRLTRWHRALNVVVAGASIGLGLQVVATQWGG